MQPRDPDECDCRCHKLPGTKHVRPCCQKCSYCGKGIKTEAAARHVKKCGKRPNRGI